MGKHFLLPILIFVNSQLKMFYGILVVKNNSTPLVYTLRKFALPPKSKIGIIQKLRKIQAYNWCQNLQKCDVYIYYKRVFFIFNQKKVTAKNLIFSHFAFNIHNNLLILSELLVQLHCKTLDKITRN